MGLGSRWLLIFLLVLTAGRGSRAETFGVGFFEGGPYPAHAEFRRHLRDQLKLMAPPGVDPVYLPDGFKSAGWDRDTARAMAAELAENGEVDLIVALGPWTVEELLKAGFDRPIVAALRYQPELEGLVDDQGRPIADNLTVRVRPDKLISDLTYLTSLAPVRRLGFLHFPSSDETERLVTALREVGRRLGFEVVTGEGYDRRGTYAFFKAYQQLTGQVDALYLSPLAGFNSDKTRQFYAMVARENVLSFASEGQFHAARGALAAGSLESNLVRAHYHVWKILKIMEGTIPADLPIRWPDDPGLVLNETVARQLGMEVRGGRRYDISVLPAPPPDDVERLSVVDAVSVALTQSPDYQARYATLEAAEKAASEARSGYLPQLDLTARIDHFDPNAVHNDDRFRADRARAELRLEQELFAPKVIQDIKQAAVGRDMAATDLRKAGLDLERAVALAFVNVVQAEQAVTVWKAYKEEVRECLQLARLQLLLDEAGAPPVWRWESEWLSAVQDELHAAVDLEVARVTLNTLLGRPGDYPFALDWQHFSDARFFREESLLNQLLEAPGGRERIVSALLSLASVHNPELTRSDLGIGLGRVRLSRNRAEFLPRLGFSARLGLSREREEAFGFVEKNPDWSIGVGVRIPLFMGGRRFRERDRLRAELDRLEYRRDQAALETGSRLRTSLALMLSLAEEFPVAARAAELADQYVPEIQARGAAGLGSPADLIDAVETDRDASLKAIATEMGYFRRVVEVTHIIGISAYEKGHSAGDELFRHLTEIAAADRN